MLSHVKQDIFNHNANINGTDMTGATPSPPGQDCHTGGYSSGHVAQEDQTRPTQMIQGLGTKDREDSKSSG